MILDGFSRYIIAYKLYTTMKVLSIWLTPTALKAG